MSVKDYLKKRDLKKSPEPAGHHQQSPSEFPHFCVQKHASSHLHYDFRLEHRGVLLSWAVPKGPSIDPADKRLAIQVEDHPLDYQYFEGMIPKGNYGAGTVEIWDHGVYTVLKDHTRKGIERSIEDGLRKGHLVIVLYGEKLKGEFVLQKMNRSPEDKNWLLIARGVESGR